MSTSPTVTTSTTTCLRDLTAGQAAVVRSLDDCEPHLRVALMELGLVPGTEVRVVRRAPLGDPLQVDVAGAQLAIRKAVAAGIEVEPRA